MNVKTLLASACAISLACGYIAGKAGSSSGRKDEDSTAAQTQPERTRARENRPRGTVGNALLDSILNGRPIGEIPAADLAAIIARLSKNNPDLDPLARAKQDYQLQLLLEELSTDDLAEIATAIQSDPKVRKADATSPVLLALADRDPDRALAWLSTGETPNSILFKEVFEVIARNDPMAAPERLHKAVLDGSVDKSSAKFFNDIIASSMARLGANPAIAYVDSLPNRWDKYDIDDIMNAVPEGECVRLLEGLWAQDEDGRLLGDGEMSFSSLFLSALASDEKGAREWFSKLPEERKSLIRLDAAVDLFEQGEREAAAGWLREAVAANPGKEKQIVQEIITPMINGQSENIPFLTRLLPQGVEFTARDFPWETKNLVNGAALTDIASVIRDPGEQARLIADALEHDSLREKPYFDADDFEILSRRIAAMGFTGENATLLNKALDAARNTKTIPD